MPQDNVCILGGTGFVGTWLTTRLCQRDARVTLLVRNAERAKHLAVLPNIKFIECDIYNPQHLEKYLAGADIAINLVGILNERGHNGDGFRRAHIDLPRKILRACQHNKVPRLLHMSALHADANTGPSHYLRSKGDGENNLHTFAGSCAVTSFRPSVIFGPGDSFFNRFASLLRLSPGIFPLACGRARFAPVFIGDVVDAFINAMHDKSTHGNRYDLCGPEDFSLHELVAYTAQSTGLHTRIINLPNLLARIQAHILEYFPGKPFSIDNYNSLKIDSVCRTGRRMPTSIYSVVPWYIGERSQQMDIYRRQPGR
jgi:nucleoside-diphosphate-sugar epimerase